MYVLDDDEREENEVGKPLSCRTNLQCQALLAENHCGES